MQVNVGKFQKQLLFKRVLRYLLRAIFVMTNFSTFSDILKTTKYFLHNVNLFAPGKVSSFYTFQSLDSQYVKNE